MTLKVYCVYDSKAENYGKPFMFDNRADALRSWEDAANASDSKIAKYPGDFTLFEIGEWDQVHGNFDIYGSKISLGLAVEYKKQDKELTNA